MNKNKFDLVCVLSFLSWFVIMTQQICFGSWLGLSRGALTAEFCFWSVQTCPPGLPWSLEVTKASGSPSSERSASSTKEMFTSWPETRRYFTCWRLNQDQICLLNLLRYAEMKTWLVFYCVFSIFNVEIEMQHKYSSSNNKLTRTLSIHE